MGTGMGGFVVVVIVMSPMGHIELVTFEMDW